MSRSAWKAGNLFIVALSMALLLTFASTALQVPVASAHGTTTQQTQPAGVVNPNDVNNCGIVTCSYYFSRAHTSWIASHGVYAAIAAGEIPGWVGKILTPVIGLVTAKAVEATSKHQCLRVRYGAFVALYSDGSGFCKNT